MPNRPEHVLMDQFPVVDCELHIGDMPLTRLASRVGQTPFYAYDRRLLSQRVELLRRTLPTEIHLHYAIKANPMPAVVQHLSSLTDGLDVASLGEMHIALNTGTAPAKISFAGPGKSDRELEAAVAAGIMINLESAGEMARVTAAGMRLGIRPIVSVRVNPDFELKTSGMQMGGAQSPSALMLSRYPTCSQTSVPGSSIFAASTSSAAPRT